MEGNAVMRSVAGATVVAAVVLSPGAARSQSIDYQVGMTACEEAARYDAARLGDGPDVPPAARRARARCRLETFRARLATERAVAAADREAERQARFDEWVDKHLPPRARRTIAADGFYGFGPATQGVAVGWTPTLSLDLEGWLGWKAGTATVADNDVADDRKTAGIRAKWMALPSYATPFVAFGVARTWGGVGYGSSSDADGNAHLLTGSIGVSLTSEGGLRLGVEYMFGWTFYSVVQTRDDQRTPDEGLRALWQRRLDEERHGARIEVGYAF